MMAELEHLDQAASTAQDIRAYIVDNMLLGDDSDLESNTSLLDAGILDFDRRHGIGRIPGGNLQYYC